MNREHWKAMLPIITAFVEGKTVQISQFEGAGWKDIGDGAIWMKEAGRYRIKPEPKLRPWKPEEVPVGAVVRRRADGLRQLLLGASNNGCHIYIYEKSLGFETILKEWELLDGSPCGVAVSE